MLEACKRIKGKNMEVGKCTTTPRDGNDHQQQPRDTYKIAYIIHFLLGAGNLLPWNALITAVDYFAYLYPTKHVEKAFSVAYMTSSVLMLIVMLSWRDWSQRLNFRFRMNLGFSLFVFSLMVAPIIDWSCHRNGSGNSTNGPPTGAYGVTVASVIVCGLADGMVGGSLIGSAGKLPKEYMQAVFAGTASSGTMRIQFIYLFFPCKIILSIAC